MENAGLEINKIYNEDCLATMSKMPDGCIDLTVTSPPYNLGISYDSYEDRVTVEAYFAWAERWLGELYRVTKADGRICINCYLTVNMGGAKVSPMARFLSIAEKVGLKYHGVAVWDERTISKAVARGSWLSASAPYVSAPFEVVLIFYKQDWKKHQKGTTNISREEFIAGCSGIWRIAAEPRKGHPAPFPLALPMRCALLFSYEGSLVYDPFMGAGTTAIACRLSNRNFIGSEISKNYCRAANARLSETYGQ